MSTFEDYDFAARFRDVTRRLIAVELQRLRPQYVYATVAEIKPDERKCMVLFPGDTTPVAVRLGSIVPREVGQIVRIDGLAGDRFVADVMGDTGSLDTVPPVAVSGLQVTPGPGSLSVTWQENPDEDVRNGAGQYQVQIARDYEFSQLAQDVKVNGTYASFVGLLGNQEYMVRVRAIDSSGNVGPWSATASATTLESTTGSTDDGTDVELGVSIGSGVSFTKLSAVIPTIQPGGIYTASLPFAPGIQWVRHIRVTLSDVNSRMDIKFLHKPDFTSAGQLRNLAFHAVNITAPFMREFLWLYQDETNAGQLHVWINNTSGVPASVILTLNDPTPG